MLSGVCQRMSSTPFPMLLTMVPPSNRMSNSESIRAIALFAKPSIFFYYCLFTSEVLSYHILLSAPLISLTQISNYVSDCEADFMNN